MCGDDSYGFGWTEEYPSFNRLMRMIVNSSTVKVDLDLLRVYFQFMTVWSRYFHLSPSVFEVRLINAGYRTI